MNKAKAKAKLMVNPHCHKCLTNDGPFEAYHRSGGQYEIRDYELLCKKCYKRQPAKR